MGLFGGKSRIDEGYDKFKATPGAVLLDVRSTGEFAGGHLPGAINLPLDKVPSIAFPKSTPLFVYCQSGARAGSAVSWLKGSGYAAENLGGIMSYHGPVE